LLVKVPYHKPHRCPNGLIGGSIFLRKKYLVRVDLGEQLKHRKLKCFASCCCTIVLTFSILNNTINLCLVRIQVNGLAKMVIIVLPLHD